MNGGEKRLEGMVAAHRREGRKLLLPFVTCGFPHPDETVPIGLALERGGASAVELGVPWSDPLADGPTIQMASQQALLRGMTVRGVLEKVEALRAAGLGIPVLLMGYANPILAYGLDAFVEDASRAGVSGLIVADWPLEEVRRHSPLLQSRNIAAIPLLAPTSPPARIRLAAEVAAAFVYAVSVTGVTGSREPVPSELSGFCERLRGSLDGTPFVVGFGIRTPEQAAACARASNGVVVGSALIERLKAAERNPGVTLAWVAEEFTREMRAGIDGG